MNTEASVARGQRPLRRLLEEQCFDLRTLDAQGFRNWLMRQLRHWQTDPLFAQQLKIRELRQAHPRIVELEREQRRAVEADVAAASYPRFEQLERELRGAEQAIAGLRRAVAQAAEKPAPAEEEQALRKKRALREKLASFTARHRTLQKELAELSRQSPTRQAVRRISDQLQQLRAATGLDHQQTLLEQMQRERGQRRGRFGTTLEQKSVPWIAALILPELFARGANGGERGGRADDASGELSILHGVTLRAARVELDHVVLRPQRESAAGGPLSAEVLAIIEVKGNINDVAHGFRRRQENLAWLTGETAGYDPREYRTGEFRLGHFDRPAVHLHRGREFRFTRHSFRHFRRDSASGFFLDRLYLITRPGPMWGASSAALNRIKHRLATDVRCSLSDEAYLTSLWRWCANLAHPLETPDVLRLYAAASRRADQILLAGAHSAHNPPIVEPSNFDF